MFTKDSRYADTPTCYADTPTSQALDIEGREITAVQLRRLPQTGGGEIIVTAADQLDVIAEQCYANPTWFWHVADANSELEARDLLQPVGRTMIVPER